MEPIVDKIEIARPPEEVLAYVTDFEGHAIGKPEIAGVASPLVGDSSMAPLWPYPALLTTTSSVVPAGSGDIREWVAKVAKLVGVDDGPDRLND
jgi:hypothetical protein